MMTLFSNFRIRLVLMTIVLFSLAACSGPSFSPGSNSEYIALDAEDVVNILSAAGFSDDEIVSQGQDFRNYLAASGSANLKDGSTTIAMFAVKSGLVHISTMGLGSYVYNPGTKEMR